MQPMKICRFFSGLSNRVKRKDFKIFFFLIFIFFIGAFFIYIKQINVLSPVSIKILSNENLKDITVYLTGPLGFKTKLEPSDGKNSFLIKTGYYKNIIIETQKISSAENNDLQVEIFYKNNKTSFESRYQQNTIIVERIGEISLYKKLSNVLITNLQKLIALILLFIFSILVYKTACLYNSSFDKKLGNFALFTTISILAVCFVLLLIAASYTYPNAEDIALSTKKGDFNFLKNGFIILLVYDARFFTNFLYGLSPFAIGGIEFHRLNSILVVIITLLIIFWSLKTFFKKSISLPSVLILSLIIFTTHLIFSPGIAYDFFYIGSSYVYLFGILSVIIWSTFYYLAIIDQNQKKRLRRLILALIFLFLSYGTIELNIFLNAYIIFIIVWWQFSSKNINKFKHETIALILSALISSSFIFMIPGNSHRTLGSPIQYNLSYVIETFNLTFFPFFKILFEWTFFNLISIPIIFLGTIICKKIDFSTSLKTKDLVIFFISGLITMYFIYYIFAFTNRNMFNEGYPVRLINYIQWLYIFLFYILLVLILHKVTLKKLNSNILKYINLFSFFIVLFFIIQILYTDNQLKQIYIELTNGTYKNFDYEIKERFFKIENGTKSGSSKIIIGEIKNKPATIFVHEKDLIGSDPELKLWIKKYNRYFNTDKISFDETEINHSLKKYEKK